jgi:hypothetical protein
MRSTRKSSIEEEDFLGFQRGEDRGEVAFALEKGSGAGFDGDVEFVGDDLREGGLAESGGTVEQDVIESFAAGACGLDGDLDVFFDALLADVFIEPLGADAGFDAGIFVDGLAGDNAIGLASQNALCAGVWHAGKRLTQRARRAAHRDSQRREAEERQRRKLFVTGSAKFLRKEFSVTGIV